MDPPQQRRGSHHHNDDGQRPREPATQVTNQTPSSRGAAEATTTTDATTTPTNTSNPAISTQRLRTGSSSHGKPADMMSPTAEADKASDFGLPSTTTELSGDLVFPIRSVVGVDPAASSKSDTSSQPQRQRSTASRSRKGTIDTRGAPGPLSPIGSPTAPSRSSGRTRGLTGPLSSVQADAARLGSPAPVDLDISVDDGASLESGVLGHQEGDVDSQVSETQSSLDVPLASTRFTYVKTDDGHAVITGRDGVLQQCEDEPIHTPGAVQGFGCLVAIHEEPDGNFLVRYVSENSERLLGYSPRSLFRKKSFTDIFSEDQQDNLLDHIDFIRDEDADPAANGPEIVGLTVRHPKLNKSFKLWCALHINAAHPDLILCEFELDDDTTYPLRPAGEISPDPPTETLQSNPTQEEIEQSTEMASKPLRILRSARKRRGEQGAMQVFDILSQVQEQLASAASLDRFLKVLVGIVKELTGFHRIMIYQFDSSFNGKVVTELVDTNQTLDLYNGLHFPASDIPRQARELYKLNKVRILYDRDLTTARIVCRSQEDLDVPLDMTHCYLRAMSPIHLKYLAHMEVRSSMSISVNAFGDLWGLIACHSYGGHGMRVSFPIRKLCRLIGETASRNIERLSYASRLQARKLINTSPTDKNPSGYIIASSDDLLRLFDAECGLLSIKDETKVLGTMNYSQEALALLEYLRMRRLTSVTASQDVKLDFPDLQYPPGFQVIAGLLYVPLSVGGQDFIVFFRKGQAKEVKWAGNPYEKNIRKGTAGYLEPRASFKQWNETVIGKCREWNEEHVETAAVLCLVYGKFIEIWRQKEAALQSSKLTRILLSNSAHEVRTPLNAIINYLEIALEGNLDPDLRDNLLKSHSASKSLVYVINDLLDLTKAEEGQNLIRDEVFDLVACVHEATDPFKVDTERKGIEYQVNIDTELPKFIHGDGRRVRQVISNITANAVTHTECGSVVVAVEAVEYAEQQVTIEFTISDTGAGMDAQQLDSLSRDLEQVGTSDSERQSPVPSEEPSNTRTLGLGLAVVGRIVRNMDGQLRLKSEVGNGSRVIIQLMFQLPESEVPADAASQDLAEDQRMPLKRAMREVESSNTGSGGEITLVERATAKPHRDGSMDSGSRRSGSQDSHGSGKSDADRLINAIQTPLQTRDKESGYFSPSKHSRGSSHSMNHPSRVIEAASGSPPTEARKSPEITKSPQALPGTAKVTDMKTPIKPVRMPDEHDNLKSPVSMTASPTKLVEIPTDSPEKERSSQTLSKNDQSGPSLRSIVADDDPINLKIMSKRLERAGHEVQSAMNGDDCANLYKTISAAVDVVLMDMQMPIVDGLTSTKMIRSMEKSSEHSGLSELAERNGRVPIFAVSASLVEEQRETYIEAGFDGWILKPIDFKRLGTLMDGICDDSMRESCLYEPGQWERGGWFFRRSDERE
ncbi:hypothetical protein K4F52_006732 [Lecanicillium sp. MT-2017a]|nr:hypothetical protein K4F52_006732 [Lecanicillium sp. MT-2017a]